MPNTPLQTHHVHLITTTTAVAMLGFFDYLLVVYLKDIILANFFGGQDMAWLYGIGTMGLFAGAYLAHPVGGFLLGQYGDVNGRRAVLLLSMLGLSVFTLIMAFLPTYEQIGILAPILFIIARFGQGMAFGGQVPATIVLLIEQLPLRRVSFGCGMVLAGELSGLFLVDFLTILLDETLSHVSMLQFGWRMLFLVGGLLSALALLLLKNTQETPLTAQTPNRHADEEHTLSAMSFDGLTKQQVQHLADNNIFYDKPTDSHTFLQIFANNRLTVLLPAVVLSWVIISVFIVIGMILPQILDIHFNISESDLTFGSGISTLFMIIGCIFYGYVSDRVNIGRLMMWGGLLLIANTTLFFIQLNFGSRLMLVWFATLGFSGGMIATLPVLMTRLFPSKIRLTSIAFTYNTTYVVVAGGLPSLLSLAVFYLPLASALYLLLVGLSVVFLGLYFYYLPRSERDITR